MGTANLAVGAAPMSKVLVADDHVLVGQGIESLLKKCFDATTLVTSGEALVESVRRDPPDIIVADISMPGISGLDAMRAVQSEGHAMPFVFLTMHDEPVLAAEAIRSGARGYILKSSAGEELTRALRHVMEGGFYVTPALAAKAMRAAEPSRHTLTEKQRHILELVARGLRSKQIAYELGLSVRTIESHKYAMMQMLEVHGTLELIRKAEQEGWISRERQ